MNTQNLQTTRLVASTYGVLAGLAGIEHGFFEVLQRNAVPSGIRIEAIGPAQRFWAHGGEPALTLIPNFLITGILAMLVSSLVVFWAVARVHRKHGGLVLILLSTLQLLVGGGIMPLFLAITGGAVATQIDGPLAGWCAHLPKGLRNALAWLFPGSFAAFLTLYFIGLEIAIFGYVPGVPEPLDLLWTVVYVMLGAFLLTAILAFVHDAQKRDQSSARHL